jgi:hypothetical protein
MEKGFKMKIIIFIIILSTNVYGNSRDVFKTVKREDKTPDPDILFKRLEEAQKKRQNNLNKLEGAEHKRQETIIKKKKKVFAKTKRFNSIKTKRVITKNNIGAVLYPDNNSTFNSLNVYEGDTLEVKIEENMIGYGDSKRAVSGEIISGNLKGYIVLGNVSMDLKTKELKVEFNKIRKKSGRKRHNFKAEMWLKGRHETKFWKYFWASVAANAVGGLAEGAKDREFTIVGSRSVVNPENMIKNSVARAGKAGAEMIQDELKNYPEFTVVIGPVIDRAVIKEEPDSVN